MACLGCKNNLSLLEKQKLSKERKAIFESRLAACKACEHSKVTLGVKTLIRCGICGCFVEVKARFPNQHCPEDRWETAV